MKEQVTAAQQLIRTIIDFWVNYSFQVMGAVIVLIVGFFLARWTGDLIYKFGHRKKWDVTLARFLSQGAKILVFSLALIIAMGKFGITIAPFVATLGAAAFGATYAIQGPLSNYGAGLSIILGRPFVVGDTITVAGVSGVVQEVKLATTILLTGDGVIITVPNKHIVGENLFNSKNKQIVEGSVGIGYGSNPEQAIEIMQKTLKEFPEICTEPGPQIGIQAFGDSGINVAYRYWAPTAKYYQTLLAVNLSVYKALRAAGIEIPFPQREVRIVSQTAGSPLL